MNRLIGKIALSCVSVTLVALTGCTESNSKNTTPRQTDYQISSNSSNIPKDWLPFKKGKQKERLLTTNQNGSCSVTAILTDLGKTQDKHLNLLGAGLTYNAKFEGNPLELHEIKNEQPDPQRKQHILVSTKSDLPVRLTVVYSCETEKDIKQDKMRAIINSLTVTKANL